MNLFTLFAVRDDFGGWNEINLRCTIYDVRLGACGLFYAARGVTQGEWLFLTSPAVAVHRISLGGWHFPSACHEINLRCPIYDVRLGACGLFYAARGVTQREWLFLTSPAVAVHRISLGGWHFPSAWHEINLRCPIYDVRLGACGLFYAARGVTQGEWLFYGSSSGKPKSPIGIDLYHQKILSKYG